MITDTLGHLFQTFNPMQLLHGLAPAVQMKMAQAVAFAVKNMAQDETWVSQSAAPHLGQVIAVSFPLLGHEQKLCWIVDAADILTPIDASTGFEMAQVTLTVQPSVYSNITIPVEMPKLMKHVHISGDAQLAEWINTLAQRLRPDVWEKLSRFVGDVPTHYVQQGVNHIQQQAKQATRSLTEQAQYALLDEAPIAIRHATLEAFGKEAQELRYGVERLEQRIALLQRASS